jgi:general secretion pathway protein G
MILAKRLRKNASRRSAFTLLEVLVVVAILVILAGTAVIYIPQYLEDSKISKAQLECDAWEKAVSTYYTKNQGNYPTSLPEVKGYIEDGQSKLIDPWGQQYQLGETASADGSQQVAYVYTKYPKGGTITKKGLIK